MPKILFRWLCVSTVPVAGQCCLVFQGGLCKASVQRTAPNKNVCKAVSTGVAAVGNGTHYLDNHIPALQSRMGGGGRLPLIYHSTGHSLINVSLSMTELMIHYNGPKNVPSLTTVNNSGDLSGLWS
ncbi:hypothetical protein PFLUV_G00083280 [Perca fluviatilis]|uniref:Uncharacterized protein n=1 Tax=Perca fluviatilis TaxID=8168 RepID=A0A6A5F729_PERFL|nr:hypothetical protein PFLUV_G00083280 [Perca fluviatilis]